MGLRDELLRPEPLSRIFVEAERRRSAEREEVRAIYERAFAKLKKNGIDSFEDPDDSESAPIKLVGKQKDGVDFRICVYTSRFGEELIKYSEHRPLLLQWRAGKDWQTLVDLHVVDPERKQVDKTLIVGEEFGSANAFRDFTSELHLASMVLLDVFDK